MKRWRDIPGFKGYYQASTDGQVRSVDRLIPNSVGSGHRLMKGKILNPAVYKNPGYPTVALSMKGKVEYYSVHSLVLLAFVGPCPEGMECRHKNGVKTDNRLENIEWNTRSKNQLDRVEHGTSNSGERNHHAKLTDRDVLQIRRLYQTGKYTQARLARKFKISASIVSEIVNNKIWRHLL